MFYDFRIRRLRKKVYTLDIYIDRIKNALDNENQGAILLANGTEPAEASAALMQITERRVRLLRRIDYLMAKKFKRSMSSMFKI